MPDQPHPEPPAPAAETYLIAAHPDWSTSRVNGEVLEVVRSLPGVLVNDLYGSYPDYDIDVPLEQTRLAAARLVVLQFPVTWYSVPPLLKLWLDEVLALNWRTVAPAAFAAVMLARRCGDRNRDLSLEAGERVIAKLQMLKGSERWVSQVREVVELDAADERRVIGDTLPVGLELID